MNNNSHSHSQAIPPAVAEQVKARLHEINALLSPYATPLTAKERQEIAKMGEKTLSFVEKSYELATDNSGLCPPFLDMTAFGIDMTDATGLRVLVNAAAQNLEILDDIVMLAGSEAYHPYICAKWRFRVF